MVPLAGSLCVAGSRMCRRAVTLRVTLGSKDISDFWHLTGSAGHLASSKNR